MVFPIDASDTLVLDKMPGGLMADNLSNLCFPLRGIQPREARVISRTD